MRGCVTGFGHDCVHVECRLIGESHTILVPHGEVVRHAVNA
jgi:hypothetical protein